jgi:hypothetical protein
MELVTVNQSELPGFWTHHRQNPSESTVYQAQNLRIVGFRDIVDF